MKAEPKDLPQSRPHQDTLGNLAGEGDPAHHQTQGTCASEGMHSYLKRNQGYSVTLGTLESGSRMAGSTTIITPEPGVS
jgi:hypothetical protein